jgi:hypothetical protein
MDADKTIDVKPTGDIQKRLANITDSDLKRAMDQKDKTLIFNKLSDSQLKELAKKLRTTASLFTSSSTTKSSANKAHLHPRASNEVALTRDISNRHIALISHPNPGKSFKLSLRPDLFMAHLPDSMRELVSADSGMV